MEANTQEAKEMRTGISIVGTIQELEEPKTVSTKFGETLVANAQLVDDKGKINFTLWGDDIQRVSNGTKVRIIQGYTTTFKNVVQLNKGRKGTMEILHTESELPK